MSQGPLRRIILAASVVLSVIGGAYADEPNLDQAARVTLACLLGGVPAASLILATGFCIYIRKRKKQLRKHALANGIELDEEGWPVHHTQRVVVSPVVSSRPEQQLDTRSYSSSAADYKAPSLSIGNPHSPHYNSVQVPAGPLTHAITRDNGNSRPSTAPGTF